MDSKEKNKYIVLKSIELFDKKKSLSSIADCWHEPDVIQSWGMKCKCGKEFVRDEILHSNPDFSTIEGMFKKTDSIGEYKDEKIIKPYEYKKGDGLLLWMMYGLRKIDSDVFFFGMQRNLKKANPHFVKLFLSEYMDPQIFRDEAYDFLKRSF